MLRQIRVLSLYEGFFAGGARILQTDVVSGLHSTGTQHHSVLSLSTSARREGTLQHLTGDARYELLRRARIPVAALDRVAGAEPPAPDTFTDAELEQAAAAFAHVDVVLSLKEQPVGLLLALHRRGLLPHIPIAVCLHRSDPEHSGGALDWLREAIYEGVIGATISCAAATATAYAHAGALAADSFVVPNGIDLDRFRPGTHEEVAAARQNLHLPASAPVVLLAARFDEMKNPELFLRAAAGHAARTPRAHYVVCGAGMSWDNPRFAQLAHAAGAPGHDRLHALGIRDDMPVVYRAADIVALTSRFGEASPLCLVEGAVSGAIPVTTDVGDAAARVDGIGAVTGQDPTSVAAAWDRVLADRTRLRAAAIAARTRFGRAHMIDSYEQIVWTLAGRQVQRREVQWAA